MNDKFKFRVWDKKNKKFLKLVTRDELCDTWISIDNTGVYQVERNNETDETFFTDITNDVDVIFFTGRKDRNGKDIYENDIIKNRETGVYYQIIWNEEATAFMAKSKNNTISTYVLFSDYQYQIEVYGNIYTTPELLEEQWKKAYF